MAEKTKTKKTISSTHETKKQVINLTLCSTLLLLKSNVHWIRQNGKWGKLEKKKKKLRKESSKQRQQQQLRTTYNRFTLDTKHARINRAGSVEEKEQK